MQLQIFQVDAFTDKIFGGNPAAVCPLEFWLPDDVMQKIALENSVAETAFFIPSNDGFQIRWFTPKIEMDLCGHATLACYCKTLAIPNICSEISLKKRSFDSNNGK